MANYSVTIGGNPVLVQAGTLQATLAIGRKSQASFTVEGDTSTFYQQYEQVAIYDQNGITAFTGYLTAPKVQKPGFQQWLVWTMQCMGQEYLAKKRVYAAAWTNKTCGFIAQDILNTILSTEGVTLGQIYDGLTPGPNQLPSLALYPGGNVGLVPQATFYYAKVADALDALATEASSSGIPYYWSIDQNKQFWFVPYTTITGPTIDDTVIEEVNNPPSVTFSNPSYRNTQYVTGGVTQTVQQIETRKGDGNTVAWPMGFNIAMVPTITVNGVSKTVGISGVDTGKNFYWNEGSNLISQDSSGVKLVSTDTLSVTYIGQTSNTAIISDASQISNQASIDGTSGINEEVIDDPTLTTAANAISEGSNLLTLNAQKGVQFQFTTRQSGFAPGQICNANLPYFGITNAQMLIDSVVIADLDLINIWYQITAIIGPYTNDWVSFYSKLFAQQAPAASINVGSTQQTSILQQFTATLTPTATLNASVLTSLFPSSGLHPASTLHPAG